VEAACEAGSSDPLLGKGRLAAEDTALEAHAFIPGAVADVHPGAASDAEPAGCAGTLYKIGCGRRDELAVAERHLELSCSEREVRPGPIGHPGVFKQDVIRKVGFHLVGDGFDAALGAQASARHVEAFRGGR